MRAFDAPLRRQGLSCRPGPATRRSGVYRGGTFTRKFDAAGTAPPRRSDSVRTYHGPNCNTTTDSPSGQLLCGPTPDPMPTRPEPGFVGSRGKALCRFRGNAPTVEWPIMWPTGYRVAGANGVAGPARSRRWHGIWPGPTAAARFRAGRTRLDGPFGRRYKVRIIRIPMVRHAAEPAREL
jgi:hypothetical protein